ncbi:hypothetical protein OS493_018072 [Desmophyllum pertusum]|uniref:Uncharacterized protein n=1 Tax=Desmophyllum pertusum TaxID=174260 RepID=A0A9W9YNK4_9CNID|nr:hypothetical protein OS493_018072 [Desmophyllum pertusum]
MAEINNVLAEKSQTARTKWRQSSNDTLEYLREASEKECKLKKAELELRKNQENALTAQQLIINQFKEQQQLQMQ